MDAKTRASRLLVALAATAIAIAVLTVATDPDEGDADSQTADESTDEASTSTPTSRSETTEEPPPAADDIVDPSTTIPAPTSTVSPLVHELEQLVNAMSPEERAAQLVVAGFTVGSDPVASGERLAERCLGGIFIKDSQRGDPDAARARHSAIAAAADACPNQPLIMTDAEAGTAVLKMPVPPENQLLPAPEIGALALNDPSYAETEFRPQAETFARSLADLGVHVNFGVIADVDVSSEHYMAREGRSFGSDRILVDTLADSFVEAHCAVNVAATLKHFPNQGATLKDPHLGVSESTNDLPSWTDSGRTPYVETTAPLVMTGHIMMQDVDPDWPTSVSFLQTTGLLREGLGYGGVVVTDDLSVMKAITDRLPDDGERAVQAIASGADLVLFTTPGPADEATAAIVAEAARNAVFESQVHRSVARILRLKAALGLVELPQDVGVELCGVAESLTSIGPSSVVVTNNVGVDRLAAGNRDKLILNLGVGAIATNGPPAAVTKVLHVAGADDLARAVAAQVGADPSIIRSVSRMDVVPVLSNPFHAAADVWLVLGADYADAVDPTE